MERSMLTKVTVKTNGHRKEEVFMDRVELVEVNSLKYQETTLPGLVPGDGKSKDK